MSSLLNKIKQKNATIGIIGLGYVGLPLAIRFSEEGFKVIGFDIDDSKVKMLNKGESYIKHIYEDDISVMICLNLMVNSSLTELLVLRLKMI